MNESVGTYLSAAREYSALSVSELAKITRIPKASILALEADDYDALPAPVFVRGFIRCYCREVDADPTEALRRYEKHLYESDIVNESEARPELPPLVLVGSEISGKSTDRGLQAGQVFLLLLALVTFIIAYVTAGIPSRPVGPDALPQSDQASTEQPATTNAPTNP